MDLDHLKRLKIKVYKAQSASLRGYKLVFNIKDDDIPNIGYANIITSPFSEVEGVLIETDVQSVSYLDLYENFPVDYTKEMHNIRLKSGIMERAFLYIGNTGRYEEGLKPLDRHLQHILKGKDFMSKAYYQNLLEIDSIQFV